MIERHIKVVLFDHDDTLVQSLEAKWKQHQHVAHALYKRELTEADLRRVWGKPLTQLVEELYGVENRDEAMESLLAVRKDFPKGLFPYTIPLLESLHSAGKKVGILTATSRRSLKNDLDLHNIPANLLDYTQTEEDTPHHKPDPRVFDPVILWLKELGVSTKETVYVGDGLHDKTAAEGAGISFIGVATGLVSEEEFAQAGIKALKDLSELLVLE